LTKALDQPTENTPLKRFDAESEPDMPVRFALPAAKRQRLQAWCAKRNIPTREDAREMRSPWQVEEYSVNLKIDPINHREAFLAALRFLITEVFDHATPPAHVSARGA